MRIAGLLLGIALLCGGCGDDDDDDDDDTTAGDGGVRDGAVVTLDARVTCMGTHAPCDTYALNPQACVNHGCQVSGSRCQGTPHSCDSFVNLTQCGDGHGCNACDYCRAGTTCIQTCIGPFLSVNTECKPSTLTCTMCSEECAKALCPANSFGTDAGISACMGECKAKTPGAFQCER